MGKAKKSPPTFEEALNNLEQKVRELEQGNLSLDEMLQKFGEGVELAKECELMLNQAENGLKQAAREESIWN